MSPAALLILVIRGYQRFLSPLLAPRCRFVPSCSAYAVEALQQHGALRGLRLTGWRLLRCQPFCRGGYDPVPPPRGGGAGRAEPVERTEPLVGEGKSSGPEARSRRLVPRPARKGRLVRHNGAHGGHAAVATVERGMGPDGAPDPPGRGDS
ncbi:MAG: membrane protein insertion efficiency factor YidD [Mycobacteriaceae bacterium]